MRTDLKQSVEVAIKMPRRKHPLIYVLQPTGKAPSQKTDQKDTPADYEEGKRLFETLNNHNPELARAIWGKQMSLTDKIAELRKEVQSAEGGSA